MCELYQIRKRAVQSVKHVFSMHCVCSFFNSNFGLEHRLLVLIVPVFGHNACFLCIILDTLQNENLTLLKTISCMPVILFGHFDLLIRESSGLYFPNFGDFSPN